MRGPQPCRVAELRQLLRVCARAPGARYARCEEWSRGRWSGRALEAAGRGQPAWACREEGARAGTPLAAAQEHARGTASKRAVSAVAACSCAPRARSSFMHRADDGTGAAPSHLPSAGCRAAVCDHAVRASRARGAAARCMCRPWRQDTVRHDRAARSRRTISSHDLVTIALRPRAHRSPRPPPAAEAVRWPCLAQRPRVHARRAVLHADRSSTRSRTPPSSPSRRALPRPPHWRPRWAHAVWSA